MMVNVCLKVSLEPELQVKDGKGPEADSTGKPEAGMDRADSGFGSSGSSQQSITPPEVQVHVNKQAFQ